MHSDGTGPFVNPEIGTVACILCCRGQRVKWMSLYLSGANWTPCRLAQAIHTSCALASLRQVSSLDFPPVRMFVSSTNPQEEEPGFSIASRRAPSKNRKKIGGRDEPLGIA